jgi:PAS domain S-box-containing protein
LERNIEISFRIKSKSFRRGLYSAQVIQHQGEEYLFAIVRDVTEYASIKETLHETEKKYYDLFNNVPIGLYKTTCDGEIIEVNKSMVEMFGFEDEKELKKHNAKDFYVYTDNIIDFPKQVNQSGVIVREVLLKKKNGQKFWVQDYSKVLSFDTDSRIFYFKQHPFIIRFI